MGDDGRHRNRVAIPNSKSPFVTQETVDDLLTICVRFTVRFQDFDGNDDGRTRIYSLRPMPKEPKDVVYKPKDVVYNAEMTFNWSLAVDYLKCRTISIANCLWRELIMINSKKRNEYIS